MLHILVKGFVGGLGFLLSLALLVFIIQVWPWGWSPSWRSVVPFVDPPKREETRRLDIRLDYTEIPAHLHLVDPPATITGEFVASDPAAFAAEVVMPVHLHAVRPGPNYFLLTVKQLGHLPDGLSLPAGWGGPGLQPAMLTLQAEYTEDAPKPWVLQEFKSKKVLSRYHEQLECAQAQHQHSTEARHQGNTRPVAMTCQHQP